MDIGRRVHMIGIGGIGISALARLLVHEGREVSGTEDNESHETLDGLRVQGVFISAFGAKALPEADCYIYSDAWLTKHPEIIEAARTRGVPVLSYFEALGSVASKSSCLIAVSGAHGKTTTTAMLIDVLEAANLNPTGIVGSLRTKTKSNFRAGGKDYFIVEADEYRRHFLHFTPRILVITNIDADHLDYYRDLMDIQSAFRELAGKVPGGGYIVCNPHDPLVEAVIKDASAKVLDYTKYIDGHLALRVLPLNRVNAGAALAVADALNIDLSVARGALGDFSGTWRRFEYKGLSPSGALVYDDYAHHPKEISVTLSSVRSQFEKKRIIVAFQPHLYSRTKMLMKEFSTAFSQADVILIGPIFAAREEDDPSVSNHILADAIRAQGGEVRAMDTFGEIELYLRTHTGEGDIILTMGAGDLYKVGEALVKNDSTHI